MRYLAAVLLLWFVAGCAGIPFQEMSDARQAVEAAHAAGAGEYAPETLREAERLLKSAEDALAHGLYRQAREEAEAARAKAVRAQSLAP